MLGIREEHDEKTRYGVAAPQKCGRDAAIRPVSRLLRMRMPNVPTMATGLLNGSRKGKGALHYENALF